MGKPKYAIPEMGEYVKAGVGYSIANNPKNATESFSAGKEAAQMAVEFMKERYGLDQRTNWALTIVFASTRYRCGEMLKGVRSITGDCPLIGCTTAGEITTQGVHDNSVSVFVLSSDVIAVGTGVGQGVRENAIGAGNAAALQALEELRNIISTRAALVLRLKQIMDPVRMIKFYPYSLIMLPPGMANVNGNIFNTRDDYLIDGFREGAGCFAPIVGGSSGDGRRAGTSYQFCNGEFSETSVVCGILTSFVKTGISTELPFVPTKKSAVVTELKAFYSPPQASGVSRGFLIEELGGTPAAEKYFEFIKEKYLFSIDAEFENYLGKGIIAENLQDKFKTEGFTLSENAMVKGEDDNWVITDREKIYIVKKEGKLNIYTENDKVPEKNYGEWLERISKKYLFSMEVGLEDDLNNCIVSEALRGVFETKGLSLPETIRITKDEGDTWLMTDNKRAYVVIMKEKGILNVYSENNLIPISAGPEKDYPLGFTDISGKMWARVPTFIRKDESIEFSSPIPEQLALTLMEPGLTDRKGLLYETTRSAVEGAIQKANISRDEIAAVIVFICCIHRWIGEEYLFDLSLDFKTGIENNEISGDLRSFLREKGVVLSTDARIFRVETNEWKIWDGKVEYVILEADGQLKIYQGIGETDLDAIKDVVGEDVPIIGFYGYGEQLADLHTHIPGRLEQSCTVMIISKTLVSQIFRIIPKEDGDVKVILSNEKEEKIRSMISEVESEPQKLLERDLLNELKDYTYVTSKEVEDIEYDLDSFLRAFMQEKFERTIDEETKQFIKNELVYLILKLKEKKGGDFFGSERRF